MCRTFQIGHPVCPSRYEEYIKSIGMESKIFFTEKVLYIKYRNQKIQYLGALRQAVKQFFYTLSIYR